MSDARPDGDAGPDAGPGSGPDPGPVPGSGPGAGPEASSASDVDWEGEGRWHDTRPASFALVTVGGCALTAGLCWAAGVTGWAGGIPLGLVLSVLMALANDRILVRLQKRTGTSVRQAAVLLRYVRQERVPADPRARRIMAELIRVRIGRQRAGAGWVAGLAVSVLATAVMLVRGQLVLGIVASVFAVLAVGQYRTAVRVRARLARLEVVLTETED